MKILLVTRNLPPLIGGMERLNWHIADELSKTHEVILLSITNAKKTAPTNCIFFGVPLSPLPLFLIAVFFRTFFICLTSKPDILFAGSGLTAPIVVFWAKIFGKKSMVYIHGLDIATDHPAYNLVWVPSIRMTDKIIVNSSPTLDICIQKGVPQDKLEIIHPGVHFPSVGRNHQLINTLKAQFQLENKKVLISVGRLTARKAIREFVDNSLPSIIQSCPDTVLVIIGDTPSQSLNKNLQSKESIIATAEKYNIQNHLIFVGNILDDELLSAWYHLADIHIFPVKHIPSDPEGFGMVAIEAAVHGTPTIAFKTGGIVDAVKDGINGILVEKNEYEQLNKNIISFLTGASIIKISEIIGFSERFSWENFSIRLNDSINNSFQKESITDMSFTRQSHAVTDLNTRIPKAKKIEILLNLNNKIYKKPLRLLEVGCGSGGIAHYFATHSSIGCEVHAVDIHDNRQVYDNFSFTKVSDTVLPFENDSFDIVITNHVIEHVGSPNEQLKHLKEINRVLKTTGTCYLAAPNRWMITEPHYNLKFLSWLPSKLRTPYLRWNKKGEFYDCEPPSLKELESLLIASNFKFENISVQALRILFELENPNSIFNSIIKKSPDNFLNAFNFINPTLIYKLEAKK